MKTKKRYYHFVVEVLSLDRETGNYKLWFLATFSSKSNYNLWLNGFNSGLSLQQYPFDRKIGRTYIKYRDYPPRF